MQQSEPTRAVSGMYFGRRRRVLETMVQDAATALLLYVWKNKTEKTHGKSKQTLFSDGHATDEKPWNHLEPVTSYTIGGRGGGGCIDTHTVSTCCVGVHNLFRTITIDNRMTENQGTVTRPDGR